jgi:transposase-like protein
MFNPEDRRQIMANIDIQCHDNRVVLRSHAFWCEFLDTWANRKVLFVVLRAFRSRETGKPVVTYQEMAYGFGYSDRRNIHNFLQEFQACEADFEQYLRRKRKVDATVVAAVQEELRRASLVSDTVLCERVSARLGRTDLTAANLHSALEQIPCTLLRAPLRRAWEAGTFHPKEAVLLQAALAALQEETGTNRQTVATHLQTSGMTPTTPEADEVVVQRQQATAVAGLLTPGAPVARIAWRIRLMVVALTLYFWNVPVSRIGQWLGLSKTTAYQWVIGLAVALYPAIHAVIAARVKATCVAVDEKWLKLKQQWHYWYVGLDEATGLPLVSLLLPTRTTWSCCWVMVTLKRLGQAPQAIITDGLASYVSAIPAVFPKAKHLLCLFHHQQGVLRWLQEHAATLPEATMTTLKQKMKAVVQTCDPRTVRRRLQRLTDEDAEQSWGLTTWLMQTWTCLDHLLPALRHNQYPRTTNAIERFFRAFQRFYKTRGGFHSVVSAHRELMLFIGVSVFTIQVETGSAPIERIVPEANTMPFYRILNDPFRYGLAHMCQVNPGLSTLVATPAGPLPLARP